MRGSDVLLLAHPDSACQHLRGWGERRQAITKAADKAGHTRDLLARHGIDCSVEAERRDAVGPHPPVLRAEDHPLQVGLRNDQAIERIVVMRR